MSTADTAISPQERERELQEIHEHRSQVTPGEIAVGAPVNIAGASGKVKALDEESGTKVECLGFAETASAGDGDIVEVFIALHQRTI